ncbi:MULTISPECIES: 1-phosphofructokinase family hexose kinase [Nocardioides]|uniref:1-phosphofructokinase family hexose kinase n=1 Tax=Nocardioides vastitatis TaxID=2568655 RepID=A0ABW0ZB71_9ACTN|nr:1-phosphofructokinase family hexose kinase [Nocardioides sp.]THJ03604.1 1-phosphofructokinase family hexose kinase [Nocardioides sp.]
MIVTVTPNPSIDRTVSLPGALVRGGVHRVTSILEQPGGKGVNISRACVAAEVPTLAVLPVAEDDPFVRDLDAHGVPCLPVAPAGPMRVNLTVTEPDGTTTKLNTSGPTSTIDDLEALAAAVLAGPAGDWVVLAGSLPPGAPDEWYAELVARLLAAGRAVAVDTSEAALVAVVDALAPGRAPSLLKPNAEELAAVVGVDPVALEGDVMQVAAAARTLVDRGVGAVLATLGGAGAVLVDATGAWHAVPPPTRVVSTVGAGDASLFGYLRADLQGRSAPERLAEAVAYGSAAASLPGTTVPTPTDVRTAEVRIRSLDAASSDTTTEGIPSWQN